MNNNLIEYILYGFKTNVISKAYFLIFNKATDLVSYLIVIYFTFKDKVCEAFYYKNILLHPARLILPFLSMVCFLAKVNGERQFSKYNVNNFTHTRGDNFSFQKGICVY